MGKICPRCGYHFPAEGAPYPQPFGCQHDFVAEETAKKDGTAGPSQQTKWRCRKCLAVTYTNG